MNAEVAYCDSCAATFRGSYAHKSLTAHVRRFHRRHWRKRRR